MMREKAFCVSVIVAVYNVERYIEKCLQSICNQSYAHLEIIVVDDGSTDGSGQICDRMAELDSRMRVIHKENDGVSSARNAGLKVATGDYVVFVDGDDYIDKAMYEKMVDRISESEAEMVICSFRYVYQTKTKVEKVPFSKKTVSRQEYINGVLKDAFSFYYSVVWNKMIPRELLVKSQILFDEQWNIMEDFRFVLQLLSYVEQIAICQDALYNYRKNNVGTATNRQISFEESFRNRRQGYLWLKECLEICGCYKQNRKQAADYLIRYLASQYAKAVFASDRRKKLCEHREIKQREFVVSALRDVPMLYKERRKLYWSIKYLWSGAIQQARKIRRGKVRG